MDQGQKNCLNKTPYTSRAKAKRTIRRIKGESKSELRAYKCPYCPSWHLTSQKRTKDPRGHLLNLNLAPAADKNIKV